MAKSVAETNASNSGEKLTAAERNEQRALAVRAMTGGGALLINGKAFKTKQWVTRTLLKTDLDVPIYVRIESPIKLSTMDPENSEFKDANGKGIVPEIFDVVNMETGEFQVVIASAVLGSELRGAYPDDGYVGKIFGICYARGDVDKRYKTFKIIELELAEDAPGGATASKVIDGTTQAAVERSKGHKAA